MGRHENKRKAAYYWSGQNTVRDKFEYFKSRMGESRHPADVLGKPAPHVMQAYEDFRIAKDRFMAIMAEEAIRAAEKEARSRMESGAAA